MKNLENVVGLQEMNLQEMREVNGGIIGFVLAAIAAGMIYDFVNNTEECIDAFKEGWDAAR